MRSSCFSDFLFCSLGFIGIRFVLISHYDHKGGFYLNVYSCLIKSLGFRKPGQPRIG